MKKLFAKKSYHELFEIGIFLKAIDGAFEIVVGALLYFIKFATFRAFFYSLFYDEIVENPHDWFWNYAMKIWHYFSGDTKLFWAILLFAHGLTKLVLAILLMQKKLWAYPVAASIFSLFAAYQIYAFINIPSWFLGIFTLYDIVVIGLILKEYSYKKGIAQGRAVV